MDHETPLTRALRALPPDGVLPSRAKLAEQMAALDALDAAGAGLLAAESDYAAAASALRSAELDALCALVNGPSSLAPSSSPAVQGAAARLRMRRAGLMNAAELVGNARRSLGLDDVGPYLR